MQTSGFTLTSNWYNHCGPYCCTEFWLFRQSQKKNADVYAMAPGQRGVAPSATHCLSKHPERTLNVRAEHQIQSQKSRSALIPLNLVHFGGLSSSIPWGGLRSRVLGGWLSKRSRPVPHAASAELSVLRSANKHFCSSISEGPAQSGPESNSSGSLQVQCSNPAPSKVLIPGSNVSLSAW